MKRQDTVLSSSSRRENVPENHHSKTLGCMSGIFHLVYKYQNRRKFLTFGRKQEKKVVSCPTKPNPLASPSVVQGEKKIEGEEGNRHFRRYSCDVPRSPTLPAEIRRWNSVKSPQNSETPPAVVARLMGLDHGIPAASLESAAEKRRKLLRALEKCDEDLKALKKIVEAVRSADHLRSSSLNGEDHKARISCAGRKVDSSGDGDEDFVKNVKRYSEFNSDQPSPVSVLHHFTSSTKRHTNGRVVQQQRKKPGEEDIINLCVFNRISTQCQSFQTKNEKYLQTSPLWSSKAMVESVDEACRDIAWGEKREVGRIGLALQDHIYRELIDEFVKDMGYYSLQYSLPFEACKRRLCF